MNRGTFHSQIYQGTARDYWVYVPEQCKANVPANLMVFQDGYYYIDETKPMMAHRVIENLILAQKIHQPSVFLLILVLL